MRNVRVSLLLAVGWLAALCVYHELSVVTDTLPVLRASAYFIVFNVLAFVGVLLAPFRRLGTVARGVALGLLTYLAGKTALVWVGLVDAGTLGSALVEAGAVAASVAIAYRIAHGLYEFEDAVTSIWIPDAAQQLEHISDARERISGEILRARRYERPVSVTVFAFDGESVNVAVHDVIREIQQAIVRRYVASKLSRLLLDAVRRTDIVATDPEHNRIIVVSPETTRDQSAIFAGRLQETAYRTLGFELPYGCAGFPGDAPTFEGLVRAAQHQAVPHPRAVEAPVVPEPRLANLGAELDVLAAGAPGMSQEASNGRSADGVKVLPRDSEPDAALADA